MACVMIVITEASGRKHRGVWSFDGSFYPDAQITCSFKDHACVKCLGTARTGTGTWTWVQALTSCFYITQVSSSYGTGDGCMLCFNILRSCAGVVIVLRLVCVSFALVSHAISIKRKCFYVTLSNRSYRNFRSI